jgi:transposase-like protein
MDTHKNARLTPKGREQMVREVVDGGLTKTAAARRFNTTPKTVAKWVERLRDWVELDPPHHARELAREGKAEPGAATHSSSAYASSSSTMQINSAEQAKRGRSRPRPAPRTVDRTTHSGLRIGVRRLCRRLVPCLVPFFRVGKLGAIEVEHEKPNGR